MVKKTISKIQEGYQPVADGPKNPPNRKKIESGSEMLVRLGMDGEKWAKEFSTRFPSVSEDDALGWFCNAIMAGYDEAERRRKTPLTNFEKVKQFHLAFGQPVARYPNTATMDIDRVNLRNGFIMEEYDELREAQGFVPCKPTLFERVLKRIFPKLQFVTRYERFGTPDIVEIADALTDILYFVYGSGLEYGVDLDACFEEVQRSNLSKLGEDGKPIYRADGKVMKSNLYQRPKLDLVLRDQKPLVP